MEGESEQERIKRRVKGGGRERGAGAVCVKGRGREGGREGAKEIEREKGREGGREGGRENMCVYMRKGERRRRREQGRKQAGCMCRCRPSHKLA